MPKIGLVVPVYKNFPGFAELMHSVDYPIMPIIIPNWVNNTGVSCGWNQGLDRAINYGCDLALVCNDDITLGPGTIFKLSNTLLWHPEYDLVTPANTRDGVLAERPDYPESPDFACFMVRPQQFVEKYGTFDENFSPAYFEDNDMHRRIKLAGGKAVCRNDAGFYHYGSVTQNWGGEQVVTSPMFESNREYYAMKWGGYPGAETFNKPFGEA